MIRYFSCIGDLDGDNNNGNQKFYWDPPDEIYRIYNLPRRLIPAEAYEDLPVSVFYLMRLIEEKRHEGRQSDWGAWALKMTGSELQTFFTQESFKSSLDESVIQAIAALDQAKFYVLGVGGERSEPHQSRSAGFGHTARTTRIMQHSQDMHEITAHRIKQTIRKPRQ